MANHVETRSLFPQEFLVTLRGLVGIHHSIYARIPPQGIYFEALVEEAFRRTGRPFTRIEPGGRNQPRHDLLIENTRLSIKTETGQGTNRDSITITKLCTTEREPWSPEVLKARVVEHLSRYDEILMLRAIWQLPVIHYQLLRIPIEILRRIGTAELHPVGRDARRRSLGADVLRRGQRMFHVHFDGSDGKCQVRNLQVREAEHDFGVVVNLGESRQTLHRCGAGPQDQRHQKTR